MVVVVGASVWRLTFTLASEVTTVTGLVGRVSTHTGFLVQLWTLALVVVPLVGLVPSGVRGLGGWWWWYHSYKIKKKVELPLTVFISNVSYNAHNYWSADYHRNNLADELSLLVHLETTRRLDHAAVRVVGQYWLSKCTLCTYLMCNLPLNSSECFTLGEPVLGKELEFNSKSGMHFSIPGIEIWNAFLNSWNWNLECIPQFLELISGIHSDFGKSELELELEKKTLNK